jgi:hypothetical protein
MTSRVAFAAADTVRPRLGIASVSKHPRLGGAMLPLRERATFRILAAAPWRPLASAAQVRQLPGQDEKKPDPSLECMYDPETNETEIERGIPWEADKVATKYARELLAAQLQPIIVDMATAGKKEDLHDDHGVQLLKLDTALFRDEEGGNSDHLSRQCIRGIWDEIASSTFGKTRRKLDVVIVGTPGIGKSRSITYGLKKLLEAGRTVIAEFRRDGSVFTFCPKKDSDGKVVECAVWRCGLGSFKPAGCKALKRSETCNTLRTRTKATRASRHRRQHKMCLLRRRNNT